jgi:hypothetical protein
VRDCVIIEHAAVVYTAMSCCVTLRSRSHACKLPTTSCNVFSHVIIVTTFKMMTKICPPEEWAVCLAFYFTEINAIK